MIFVLIIAVLLGPPLALIFAGFAWSKDNPERAKLLYILAVVYLIVSGGICASILSNLRI